MNFIFIPIYGFVAAAYTTLASYIVLAVMDYFFSIIILKKKHRNTKIYDVKGLTGLFIAFAMLSAGVVALYNYIILRYVIVAVCLILMIVFRKTILKIIKGLRQTDETGEVRIENNTEENNM